MARRSNDARPALILKANDIDETIGWYAAAGFAIDGDVREPSYQWCQVSRDGTVLQFRAGETPWPGQAAMTGTVYVHPDSVAEVHRRIAGEIDIEWGPVVREWGLLELGVRDPNGYYVTFTEPAG